MHSETGHWAATKLRAIMPPVLTLSDAYDAKSDRTHLVPTIKSNNC